MLLTHNCSHVSIYIVGTYIRAARTSWTLLPPCRHLIYRILFSAAHVPDAAFRPGPPLLPHIFRCYSRTTACMCPYTSLGRVYVQRAQAGRNYRHVGTSYTEFSEQKPPSSRPFLLACGATAAPHISLLLTHNCSHVSIYIVGTCLRAARAS